MRRGSKLGVVEDHALQHELIGLIYDAASSPGQWTVFLERLVDCLELSAATFFLAIADSDGTPSFMPAAYGLDDAAVRDYEQHFGWIDPIRLPAMRLPSGTICPISEIVPDQTFVRSEFFNDYYAPHGMRYGFTSLVDNDARVMSALACHRAADHRPPGEEELRLLEVLTPHLQRARALSATLGTLRSQHRVASSVLDGLSVGLVFVDRSGACVGANSTAEAILLDGDGLALRQGRLVASDGCETESLNTILRNACDPERMIEPTTPLSARVSRPDGRRPLDVMACPVGSGAPTWATDRAAAFVVISDGSAALDGKGTRLRELYGLSAAEAQLAIAIANGTTVQEHAASRGISVETVRWQLKQVFAKTDVTRQSDLARIVLLGPAIAR